MRRKNRNPREGVMSGLVIAALGVLFLLHQLDVIRIGDVWAWWPWIVIGLGVIRIAVWASAESVGSGFGLALFGVWFLITVNGWWGFDWTNSWPLALVAVGLSMVTRALLQPLFRDPVDDAPSGGGSHA